VKMDKIMGYGPLGRCLEIFLIILRYVAGQHDDILSKKAGQLSSSCLEAAKYGQQGTYVLLKHWY
jgi:hypothetical protein